MRVFYEQDADLKNLSGQKVAIIGYGNQGRAQGMNLRDSGVQVVVGSIPGAGADQAKADGFPVLPIAEAAKTGDVLCLFLPDEVMQGVYQQEIAPGLRAGQTLNFAHGYNIRYGFIKPPAAVNLIMVAPRMIGVGVRERFVAGSGAPAFVAVERDANGQAWGVALAIAKGIGATRVGALEVSFAVETELDHYMEQAFWPVIMRLMVLSYDLLVKKGFPPEAVLLEFYGSGEAAEIFREMASEGMFKQMSFHSHTSQYGTLSRGSRMLPDGFRVALLHALEEIRNGTFAREWEAEQRAGYPKFGKLKAEALAHEINQVEERLRQLQRPPTPRER
jgi:ketol-acid reductoisomerase